MKDKAHILVRMTLFSGVRRQYVVASSFPCYRLFLWIYIYLVAWWFDERTWNLCIITWKRFNFDLSRQSSVNLNEMDTAHLIYTIGIISFAIPTSIRFYCSSERVDRSALWWLEPETATFYSNETKLSLMKHAGYSIKHHREGHKGHLLTPDRALLGSRFKIMYL